MRSLTGHLIIVQLHPEYIRQVQQGLVLRVVDARGREVTFDASDLNHRAWERKVQCELLQQINGRTFG